MGDPTIVINIYNGTPPCGCGGTKPTTTTTTTTPTTTPKGARVIPPDNSDPPCSSCIWSIPTAGQVELREAVLADQATGGYPITKVRLVLIDEDKHEVSHHDLPDCKARTVISGRYDMPTERAVDAHFEYVAKDGLRYTDRITPR